MQQQRLLPRAVFAALLATAAWGQSFTAAMRGTVTDGTGAVVPGANVVVTESARNVPHTTVTDKEGRYFPTALPPGSYSMAVEAPGFRKYSLQAFELVVQQQATIDVKLDVGELTSVVSVESAAPLLNTTTAALG